MEAVESDAEVNEPASVVIILEKFNAVSVCVSIASHLELEILVGVTAAVDSIVDEERPLQDLRLDCRNVSSLSLISLFSLVLFSF